MQKRLHLYLSLLFILTALFPSATALAQADQTLFLPSLRGYDGPRAEPYDGDPRDLVIFPRDLDGNGYVLLREIPLGNGFVAYAIHDGHLASIERNQGNISFKLETSALIFNSERDAQRYLREARPRFDTWGFDKYYEEPSAYFVYVKQETNQGVTYLHTRAIVFEKNIMFLAESLEELSSADPMRYSQMMLDKLQRWNAP